MEWVCVCMFVVLGVQYTCVVVVASVPESQLVVQYTCVRVVVSVPESQLVVQQTCVFACCSCDGEPVGSATLLRACLLLLCRKAS
jgi:hypothetical protein